MTLRADVHVDLGGFRLDARVAAGPGEVVAVVGPNGSGKTTLLRALAGLVPGAAVTLGGQAVDGPPEQRRFGVVFQDGALFPHLTALENVAFAAGGRDEAEDWLARVGLADDAAKRPEQLSAGRRQRVALARALATRPRALLLDEPFAAVDVASRPALRRLVEEEGVPTILVTHDPVDARLAARVVVLEDGRVVQEGTPDEVTARPASEWAAETVAVNLLPADLVPSAPPGTVALVAPTAVTLSLDQPVTSARNVWQGTVEAVEHHRGRVRVRVGLPSGHDLVAEVTAAAAEELGLRDGAEVWASAKATEVVVSPG